MGGMDGDTILLTNKWFQSIRRITNPKTSSNILIRPHQATVWPPRPPVPAPTPRPLHRPWHRRRAPSPPQWRQRWRRCRLRSWLPSHPPKPSPARLRRPSRSSRRSPDGKGLLVSFGTLKYCSQSVVTKILRQVIFDEIWPAFGWFLWVEFMPLFFFENCMWDYRSAGFAHQRGSSSNGPTSSCAGLIRFSTSRAPMSPKHTMTNSNNKPLHFWWFIHVYTTHLWWFGGWFIVLTTWLTQKSDLDVSGLQSHHSPPQPSDPRQQTSSPTIAGPVAWEEPWHHQG